MESVRSLGDLDPLPADDLSVAKVSLAKDVHLRNLFSDSLAMCMFVPWTLHQHVELLRALTGWDYTEVEPVRQGERVATFGRAFFLGEGLMASDDQLPQRFFAPTPIRPLKHKAI